MSTKTAAPPSLKKAGAPPSVKKASAIPSKVKVPQAKSAAPSGKQPDKKLADKKAGDKKAEPVKKEEKPKPSDPEPEPVQNGAPEPAEDPYSYDLSSSDSDDEGPPPVMQIESLQDVGALRSSFLEMKDKPKEVDKQEITERLGKENLSSITSAFEKGPQPADGQPAEREKLTNIDKEKYSSFKNKFEHIDEELEKASKARLEKLHEAPQGAGKEKLSEALNLYEGKGQPEEPVTDKDKRIEILRSEADKRRIQRTFQKAQAKEEPTECLVCGKTVYAAERLKLEGQVLHRPCFKCSKCEMGLSIQNYGTYEGNLYCYIHIKEFLKPGTLGLEDPNAIEQEIQDEEVDEDYAVISRPKVLNPDIIRSGMKSTDDFGQLPDLKSTKTMWEVSAEQANTKLEKKTEVEGDVFKQGKVKSRMTKFAESGERESSSEGEEEEDADKDPNILREDKKKKREIIKAEVGTIKSKWETGEVETPQHELLDRSTELDEVKKSVNVRERFKEKDTEDDTEVRQSAVLAQDQIDFAATGATREMFVKGDAFKEGPVERTTKDDVQFRELESFKERFEKGEIDEHEMEKTAIDVRCAELGDIKGRFEQGDKPEEDENAELKRKQIEDEFLRYKKERRKQQEKERREAEEAAEFQVETVPYKNPDDVRQSAEMGSIKQRFEEGLAFKSDEALKKERDETLEIKVAGKAREKFQKIDKDAPLAPVPNGSGQKAQESKWARDEAAVVPEPVNRRVVSEVEDNEPEDFEVKNLLSKFKNMETTKEEDAEQKPKPKRVITPPPSDYKAELESQAVERDPSVVTSEETREIQGIHADAKNLKAKFESQAAGDVPEETAEEKRKRLEEEFKMYKELKEKERAEEPTEPTEPEPDAEKEDLGISAEHAQKMKAKWEKIHKKEAKKAEKSAMRRPTQTESTS